MPAMRRLSATACFACRRAIPALALAGGAAAAHADPADYVFVPYTTAGQRILAYGSGFERDRDGSHVNQQTLTVGASPTERWSTSLYAGWVDEGGIGYGYDEAAWLNQWQLTAPDSGPVAVGLLCEIERPRDRSAGTGLLCGSTLQFDSSLWQVNVNPLLEHHFNAADPEPTAFRYQWQVKRLMGRGFELGAQGFGELGPWNHWAPAAQQSHILGPAVFLKGHGLGGQPLSFDAALLLGAGGGSPHDVLRARLQQSF